MFYDEYEDERANSHLATPAEAVAEFAYNYGMDHPTEAWILHDWDVWVANPHYSGPKVRHPEDDGDYEEVYGPFQPVAKISNDDIPF